MRFPGWLLCIAFGLQFVTAAQAQSTFQLLIQDQNSNASPVANGGGFTLSANSPIQTVTVTLIATYEGSGQVTTGSMQLIGSPEITVSPIPSASYTPGTGFRATVTFTPTAAGEASAQLLIPYTETITTGSGATASTQQNSGSIQLNVVGTTPNFVVAYFLPANQDLIPLSDGANLTLTPATGSATASAGIVVQNQGSGAGDVTSVTVTGAGFQLQGLTLLPGSVNAGSALQFTVQYTPFQAANATGSLQIVFPDHTVTINLTGITSGTVPAQLTYSYSNGGGANVVTNNGTVIFSPTQISQSSTESFTIQNTGTAPATVNSISVAQATSAFSLSSLPSLPATIAAGASVSFNINFAPTVPGSNTATLLIDSQSFTLFGSGNPPPTLPGYQFVGASGTQQALQQPAIGLTLNSPYPLAITGTLTLNEIPNSFSPDPAVQFSTGGQTANFTIPANTTQAIFSNGSSTIRFQTGSVAGTINITPVFNTGAINLTPASPATLQITVPAAAPQLLGMQLAASSPTSFALQIVGVTTSRVLSKLNFTFTPVAGKNLQTTQAVVDVSTVASTWFASSASTPFGGQFTITVPFTLSSSSTSGSSTTVQSLLTAIQSVSVTAVNDVGTSNSVTAQIQ